MNSVFDNDFPKRNKGKFHIPKDWRGQLANVPAWIREYFRQQKAEEIFKDIWLMIVEKGDIKSYDWKGLQKKHCGGKE